MKVEELLLNLKAEGFRLTLQNGDLKVSAPKEKLTPFWVEKLRANKAEVIKILNREVLNGLRFPLVPIEEQEYYATSHTQRRLWILNQLGAGAAYSMPDAYILEGDLNVKIFKKTFERLILRHESLRTKFINVEDVPRQKIVSTGKDYFIYLNYSRRKNPIQSAKDFIHKEVRKSFDLENGPLIRVVLIRLGQNNFLFLLSLHHIIADGQSIQNIVREVCKVYELMEKSDNNGQISRNTLNFKDYSAWQNQRINGEKLSESRRFWMDCFSEPAEPINLPLSYNRPLERTFRGSGINQRLEDPLAKNLFQLAKKTNSSLFIILLSLTKTLLHRYSGQADITVGTPVTGRVGVEQENQIGFFANTVALRTHLSSDYSFLELVREVREVVLTSYNHHLYPFDKLVTDLELERDLSRSPLFDVFIIYNELTLERSTIRQFGNIKVSAYSNLDMAISKFDLSFNFTRSENGISLYLQYNSDLFSENRIRQLLEHYVTLAKCVTRDLDKPIGLLEYLSSNEQRRFSKQSTQMVPKFPESETVVSQFEKQVRKTPHAIALVCKDLCLSYSELDERANILAAFIQSKFSTKENHVIGLILDRSEWLVLAMLGILKAGSAFLPIDGKGPAVRINQMLTDCSVSLVLTVSQYSSKLESFKGRIIRVIDEWPFISKATKTRSVQKRENQDLMYVIYTSGSTGLPKGVGIPHSSVVNFLVSMKQNPGVVSEDCLLSLTTAIFDISILEIFLPLITGAKLILSQSDGQLDEIVEVEITRNKPTIMQATPTFWTGFLELSGQRLQGIKVLCGGERLTARLSEQILGRGALLWNMFGPTETTIWSAVCEILEPTKITIGDPIANTDLYVLDQKMKLVPEGVEGELYIGGMGLARGYMNRPELTCERFIPNPLKTGSVIYKTGDLVMMTENGGIVFIGRNDHQVKIRGYRIELAEIENVLLSMDSIREVVVVDVPDDFNGRALAAYFVSNESQEETAIRSYLSRTLPVYMVPTYYCQLDQMPLTNNGKVNRKSLPKIRGILKKPKKQGGRTPTEKALVLIWEALLGKSPIGINDNFFELGGHSLLAVKVVAHIHRELKTKITLRLIFTRPTISELAKHLDEHSNLVSIPIKPLGKREYYATSDAQKRMWVQHIQDNNPAVFNLSGGIHMKGKLKVEILTRAFTLLVQRHEILRTNFDEVNGEIIQRIHDAEESQIQLKISDFKKSKNGERLVDELIKAHHAYCFDLRTDSLIRVNLIGLAGNSYILLVNIHHIISDERSLEVIVRELGILYQALDNGLENPLPPLKIHYKEYAEWQLNQLKEENISPHRDFWKEQFSGELPQLEFSYDYSKNPHQKSFTSEEVSTQLSNTETKEILTQARETNVTLFAFLMTCVKVIIYRYTGQQDVILGTPFFQRENFDLMDQVGFYVNTLAIRTKLNVNAPFEDALKKVGSNILNAIDHHLYPFNRVMEDISQKNGSVKSLFNVMIIMQNEGTQNESIEGIFPGSGLEIHPISNDNQRIGFDLLFMFQMKSEKLQLTIRYNSEVFARRRVENMLGHLVYFVNQTSRYPAIPIYRLPILREDELDALVQQGSAEAQFPEIKTVTGRFHEQVHMNPHAVAIAMEDRILTFEELDRLSNRLANYMRSLVKINQGDLIGVVMDRSEMAIISWLSVLKVGAAYVPIDPIWPKERVRYVLKDTKLKLALTDLENSKWISQESNITCIIAKEVLIKEKDLDDTPIEETQKSDDLAYVIYTSGSTGLPKGALVPHKGIVRLIESSNYGNLKGLRLLQSGNLSFDAATFDFWGMLLNSCPVIMLAGLVATEPRQIKHSIIRQKITVMLVITSWFNFLIDTDPTIFSGLKTILVGGDKLSPKHIRRLMEASDEISVINAYGPTENTTISLCYPIKNIGDCKDIPIGTPISKSYAYVLDCRLQPVPTGVVGELFVGGDGLANGYLNRPELTFEKFIPDPFVPQNLVYRTGDMVKWSDDGNILFIGRNDNQVKIRGYRIEIGEVENAVRQHPKIDTAAVLIEDNHEKEKRLICYYVSSKGAINPQDLHHFLIKSLPGYMIPEVFGRIKKMPLTVNGKIDRKILLQMESVLDTSPVNSPSTNIESVLAKIWKGVLNKNTIGVSDNFFYIGGHSLSANRVIAQIENQLRTRITLRDFFVNPTIQEIARIISIGKSVVNQPINPLAKQPNYEVSHAQRRMWILHQLDASKIAYNLGGAIRLLGVLDIHALKKAFEILVERHESLRTGFEMVEDDLKQRIYEPGKRLPKIEVTETKTDDNVIQEMASEFAREPFDLEKDVLLAVKLVLKNEEESILMINIHHIISDGESLDILINEIMELYRSLTMGKPSPLAPLRVHYKEFAHWQNDQMSDKSWDTHRAFWLSVLEDEIPELHLPADFVGSSERSSEGAGVHFRFSKKETQVLQKQALNEDSSMYMLLLASVFSLLYKYTGQGDIAVGTPVSNRGHVEWENQIGIFVNTMVIRMQPVGTDTFGSLLHKVKDYLLKADEHKQYPYDLILTDLQQNGLSRNQLFNVWVVFLNNRSRPEALPGKSALQIENFPSNFIPNRYDLKFIFELHSDQLYLKLEYNRDLFSEGTILRLGHSLDIILTDIDHHMSKNINKIKITRKDPMVFKGVAPTIRRRERPNHQNKD